MKGKIQSRQQELGEEWGGLDEEGLRTELRQTSWARQVENHGMEEPLEKNLHRREEQDKQMLTPSMKMRQREGSRMFSMADSKSRTPLPQGAGGGLQRAAVDNFDPHAEERTKEEKRALSLLGGGPGKF